MVVTMVATIIIAFIAFWYTWFVSRPRVGEMASQMISTIIAVGILGYGGYSAFTKMD